VYEESGDYVQTFTNMNGCDSVVTLHLTIYEPETELVELTLCENDLPYHYVNGDIDTIFEVGTPNLSVFNFQFSTSHGCDSVVTLTLTIEPCDTNGINENGIVDITLYPNPTTGMVNVQFTMNNVQLGAGEIQVLDVYGRLLQNVETCHGASLQTTQIDLSQYTPGVYLIRLVGDGRVIGVRKVVRR
ncbi:MAG: T9SS type A sorting domain-containing protein, partial [Bacteroidales bacterium]|nr:T9SS type A sorting domain-containing protein [Bacteroidales bacterium]